MRAQEQRDARLLTDLVAVRVVVLRNISDQDHGGRAGQGRAGGRWSETGKPEATAGAPTMQQAHPAERREQESTQADPRSASPSCTVPGGQTKSTVSALLLGCRLQIGTCDAQAARARRLQPACGAHPNLHPPPTQDLPIPP